MRFHGIVSFFHTVEPFSVIEREAYAGKVKLFGELCAHPGRCF
jgi:hypothetical protein